MDDLTWPNVLGILGFILAVFNLYRSSAKDRDEKLTQLVSEAHQYKKKISALVDRTEVVRRTTQAHRDTIASLPASADRDILMESVEPLLTQANRVYDHASALVGGADQITEMVMRPMRLATFSALERIRRTLISVGHQVDETTAQADANAKAIADVELRVLRLAREMSESTAKTAPQSSDQGKEQ